MLTQPACHSCDALKTILAELADEFVFEVTEEPMTGSTGLALAEQHGVAWAPGLFIDGELVAYGRPSRWQIRREFEHRTTLRTTTHQVETPHNTPAAAGQKGKQ